MSFRNSVSPVLHKEANASPLRRKRVALVVVALEESYTSPVALAVASFLCGRKEELVADIKTREVNKA